MGEYIANFLNDPELSKTITSVTFDTGTITDIGLGYLLESLENNKTLTSLTLHMQTITGDILRQPSKSFINTTLKELSLSVNKITDYSTISKYVEHLHGLNQLSIQNNPIVKGINDLIS